MDANGQRFWQLADARQFPGLRDTEWHADRRVLRLASERELAPVLSEEDARAAAVVALAQVPRAIDECNCVAYWDATASAIMASSHLPAPTAILGLPEAPTDLCVGRDGVLYVAQSDGVRLHDLRGRWKDTVVALPGFVPWRLAPAAKGGVWVLEKDSGRIARVSGQPLRRETPAPDDYDPDVFRPAPENCHSPRLALIAAPAWGDEAVIALACLPDGDPVLLTTWRDGDGSASVRRWYVQEGRLSSAQRLQGAFYAYSIAALGDARVAIRIPGRRDAPAFDLAATGDVLVPRGEVFPLGEDAQEAGFANGPVLPPRYPAGERAAQPLYPLSIESRARRGEAASFIDAAAGFNAFVIDSGDTTTVWHRLYAEAAIPARCGFVVWLAAGNETRPPDIDDLTQWHPHGFGRDITELDDAVRAPGIPCAAWDRSPSELPGHPGLLDATAKEGCCGLFSVLVQNARQRVRRLAGRYLWVRVVLHGNGRATPEIAALRAWGSRFDYVERYLPRLYRETLFGDAATAPGAELDRIDEHHAAALDDGGELPTALRARLLLAQIVPDASARVVVEKAGQAWRIEDMTAAWRVVRSDNGLAVYRPQASPADFSARLLSNFEGVLTGLEDRIAAAHLFSDPDAVPQLSLEWLAGWIGVAFDPILPAKRRRAWLRAASDLARWHGTRNGMRLALDVATGGSVASGEIVVIEDFRLRRILATLLGVDLSDKNDPLLPGLGVSGNSVVGDTLFVGDEARTELMALFQAAAATAAETEAVQAFYGQLAHRATILVHNEVERQDFALIERIAQLEAPAHVEVSVKAASWPLLVGIASLVGVDTYLGPPRKRKPVRVGVSDLGIADYLVGVASLDPRLAGAPNAVPPAADAGPDRPVPYGESFTLDAGASHTAGGHRITQYIWRRLPQD